MASNFEFLISPESVDSIQPAYVGPNIKSANKMTPKKFAHSVLEVFDTLGGASWLMTQAQADPKAFLDLLKRMIPKSIQLDDLQGVHINLIDQFGNTVQIQTNSPGAGDTTSQKNSPQNDTGGNLLEEQAASLPLPATPPAPPPDIDITDIFK